MGSSGRAQEQDLGFAEWTERQEEEEEVSMSSKGKTMGTWKKRQT